MRPRKPLPPGAWWLAVLWTVGAASCLNLLLGYLLVQALWPEPAPALAQGWLPALGAAGAVFVALAVGAWAKYLRARARGGRP